MDEAVEKGVSVLVLAESLKELGLKAEEAIDYIEEFNQRIAIRRSKTRQSDSPSHEPSGPADPAQAQKDRDRAVQEAAWASLRSRLETSAPTQSSDLSSNVLDKVFELLAQEASPSTLLSKSVLAVAPHLADDEDTLLEDPYLNETQKSCLR